MAGKKDGKDQGKVKDGKGRREWERRNGTTKDERKVTKENQQAGKAKMLIIGRNETGRERIQKGVSKGREG